MSQQDLNSRSDKGQAADKIEDPGFYIGWMPNAPSGLAKHLRKTIVILLPFVLLVAGMLALIQKKFGTGNFEFGILTEVKGVYFSAPFPGIKVINGKDIFGNISYVTIPLIGYGKFGAESALAAIEKEKKISLNGKQVTMKGTLLYNDGKLLMQIDANDHFLSVLGSEADSSLRPIAQDLGIQTISGEIIDPKCFFGVMKPGEGKPHKDCAIRCILGGIAPLLKVTDRMGNKNYYLIAGSQGEKMNESVKDFVAEPVMINARVVKYDDWIILYVSEKGIARYSYIQEHFAGKYAGCGTTCIK